MTSDMVILTGIIRKVRNYPPGVLFMKIRVLNFLSLKPYIKNLYGIVIAEGVELYQFRLYLIYICKFLFLCDSFAPPLGLKPMQVQKGYREASESRLNDVPS